MAETLPSAYHDRLWRLLLKALDEGRQRPEWQLIWRRKWQ